MADFFARLAERALGRVPVLQPLIVPSFAPVSIAADLPQDTTVASELEFEETREQTTPVQVTPIMPLHRNLAPNGPLSTVEDSVPTDETRPEAKTQHYDLEQIPAELPTMTRSRPSPRGREQEDVPRTGRPRLHNLSERAVASPESDERPEVPGLAITAARPRPPPLAPRQRQPITTGFIQDTHTASGDADAAEDVGAAVPRRPRSPVRTVAITSRRQPEPASATPLAQSRQALDSTAASTRLEEPLRVRTPQQINVETEAEAVEGPPARLLANPKESQPPMAAARVQPLQETPYAEEPAAPGPTIPLTDRRAFNGPGSRPEAQPPTIRVTIGRIEIRASVQAPPTVSKAAPRRRGPALPLAEYLEQRTAGKR